MGLGNQNENSKLTSLAQETPSRLPCCTAQGSHLCDQQNTETIQSTPRVDNSPLKRTADCVTHGRALRLHVAQPIFSLTISRLSCRHSCSRSLNGTALSRRQLLVICSFKHRCFTNEFNSDYFSRKGFSFQNESFN